MAKLYTDVMIDLETLALTPDAKILSIAAVAFDPFDSEPDYLNYPTLDLLVDIDSQVNRVVNMSTVEWWSQQDAEVKEKIFSETGRLPLPDALNIVADFCKARKRIWAQGITVDISVLCHAFTQYDMNIPWPYVTVSDSRTILDLAEVDNIPVTHDSIQDCFRQIINLQSVLKKLNITKFVRTK